MMEFQHGYFQHLIECFFTIYDEIQVLKLWFWAKLTSHLQAQDPQTTAERDWQRKPKWRSSLQTKKRGSGCIEALRVFPIIYRFFCHPRWGRNFSINSMSDKFVFLLLFVLKAMKVAKTLPEVRGFWKVTWPLNLDFHLRSYDLQFFFGGHLPSHLTAGFVCSRKLRPFQNWRKKSRRRRCAIAGLGYISKGYPTPMPPPGIITP